MYLIKAGEYVIYDSRDKNTYPVIKPSIHEALNEAGTLTFTILPGHPHYDKIKKMQTFVTAWLDNMELFYGRVLVTDKRLDGQMEVTCEGGLTFLLDSEMGKGKPHENIASYFTRVINNHNSLVETAKRFAVGTISATKALDTATQYDFDLSNYTNTKEVIESMITGRYGGYVRIRSNGSGGHVIDYIEDYGRLNNQPIRIGHNIVNKDDHVSGENIFTVLRPLGRKEATGESGEDLDLTIESMSQSDITLPNVVKDGTLLRLTDKIEMYGIIMRTETFNSATTAQDLLRKAEEYIKRRGTQLPATCEINAVDFHHLNPDVMDVRLGDTFNNIEGFEGQIMTVGERDIDMENPGNDSYVLKNAEEINANRLDYNVDNSRNANGGSSSSSLSSASAKSKSQDAFRYKYYHEETDKATIAAKNVEINSTKLTSLSNKTFLTVEDREEGGQVVPGEFVIKAIRKAEDPNGSELFMDVRGITLKKKDGYSPDGETILNDYATTAALNLTNGQIEAEVTRATAAEKSVMEYSSLVKQTADSVSAEVKAARDGQATLSAKIQLEAGRITSEVTDRTNADAALSSSFTQTANAITLRVGNNEVAIGNVSTKIDNLMLGNATATQLLTNYLYAYRNFNYKNTSCDWVNKTVKDGNGNNMVIHYIGYEI